MALPSEITIKEEKENYEEDTTTYDFDYDVKIESSLLFSEDTCLKSEPYEFSEDLRSHRDIKDEVNFYEDHVDNKHKCLRCEAIFYDSYSLIRHNLKHLCVRLVPLTRLRYQCNNCLRYFKQKTSLQNHIWDTHMPRKQEKDILTTKAGRVKKTKCLHQCNFCSKIFTYRVWHSHMREVHGNNHYECKSCHKMFKCSRYLRTHLRKVHKWRHLEKPSQLIQCAVCPALLKNKEALKTHTRNCHCEKVRCHMCPAIMKKAYLTSHIKRVHYYDGKKYACDCGKKFKSPRYLKVHIRKSHKQS